jgi:hypothetical protein
MAEEKLTLIQWLTEQRHFALEIAQWSQEKRWLDKAEYFRLAIEAAQKAESSEKK